jgi:pyrroline-5-carboxylate reductase
MSRWQLSSVKIAFVGAGSMAEAIIRGLVEQQITRADQLYVMNRTNHVRLIELQAQYGVNIAESQEQQQTFLHQADVIVLCMKPKDVALALVDLRTALVREHAPLLISLVAGLSIAKIISIVHSDIAVVRTMPNTSSTIGLGATGMSFHASVDDARQQLAIAMFQAIGIVSLVNESQLDLVTGVSGSGPAYVYYFMEAMIQAAIDGGLARDEAYALTIQTFLGAAHMVQQTGEDPQQLRRKVTSPQGATHAAIVVMEQQQVTHAIIKAVNASAHRSKEMGEQIR